MSWVKLHSKITDSKVFANEGLLKVWVYCLCRANRNQRHVSVTTGRGETVLTLEPGEFLFGREKAAQDLGMPASTVRNRMKKLQLMGNICQKVDTHYSVVSICNWDTYQGSKNEKGQPKDNQRTTKGQPKDTDKSIKRVKRDKSKDILPDFEAYRVYGAYPRKVGKPDALKKIKSAGEKFGFDYLLAKTQAYAEAVKGKQRKYIPHPATWFGQERFEDDPAEWSDGNKPEQIFPNFKPKGNF